MVAILIGVIIAFIMGTETVVDAMLTHLSLVSFYAEDFMSHSVFTGTSLDFGAFFSIGYDFGVALIVLKFLKKGFEQYVVWSDGDPDLDPLNFVVGFLKALALASAFSILYSWMVLICTEVVNEIMNSFHVTVGSSLLDQIVDLIAGSLFQAVSGLAMVILFVLIWIQMIGRGVEILVLRIGFPIACAGLIDSDKGSYAPYMKKFFMSVFTVIVQVFLVKLAITVMGMGNLFYALGVSLVAVKTPKVLQEFMLFATGGGGVTNGIYHTSRIVQMAKSVITKK